MCDVRACVFLTAMVVYSMCGRSLIDGLLTIGRSVGWLVQRDRRSRSAKSGRYLSRTNLVSNIIGYTLCVNMKLK